MAAARFASDLIGALDDSVRLQLGNDEIFTAESWDVTESVFAQPNSWAIRLGSGYVAADVLARYPLGKNQQRTPFALYVGGAPQMSGYLGGRGAQQPPGGATTVVFHGRDALQPLHDTFVDAHQDFSNYTYVDLVVFCLKRCGINVTKDPNGPAPRLLAENDANRAIKAGVSFRKQGNKTVLHIDDILAGRGLNPGILEHRQEAKVNETWHHTVRRYIDRAGLFLWATASGDFVLGQPHAAQPPIYAIVRDPATSASQGVGGQRFPAVIAMDFNDDASHRHSTVTVYGRGGGKKAGRAKALVAEADSEMVEFGYGLQTMTYHDVGVKTPYEASFFANRKLAEERRDGWRLDYTISGHTLPAIDGSGDRYVVTADTTVQVIDNELGINGVYYISDVRRQRSEGGTITHFRVARPSDLVFGGTDT